MTADRGHLRSFRELNLCLWQRCNSLTVSAVSFPTIIDLQSTCIKEQAGSLHVFAVESSVHSLSHVTQGLVAERRLQFALLKVL